MMHRQKGFTIVELLIATMAFSVILLVLMAGLLQIGRTYYKGLTNSRTQEAARTIIDDVSRSIQFNGGDWVWDNSGPDLGYCVGSRQYAYVINQQVKTSPVARALVASTGTLTNCAVQNITGPTITADSQELLGENMRLGEFRIESIGNNLYKITVEVGYGEYDLFEGTGGGDIVPDLPLKCKNERSGGQFCSVARLTTVVQKRV